MHSGRVTPNNAAMARRIAPMICLGALVLAGAFLFLHTGEPADGVCMRERFVSADGLSLWPPGTRCTFGEPPRTDVLVNAWLGLVLVPVVVGCAVGLAWRSARA
jgi:hypothetical protein